MNRLDLLQELQAVDMRIDEHLRTRRELEDRLSDESAVAASRRESDAAQSRVTALRTRLRTLELEEQSLEDKIKSVDARLYGGRVSNPKELSGLEQDEQMLKRRQSELEDRMLELMADAESAEADASAKRAALEKISAARDESNTRDRAARAESESAEAKLNAAREQLRSQLAADDVRVYDSLRREKRGRALAQIKGANCSACGYAVPSGLASRVRVGEELVFCTNCGRILVP
jgi:predicted  nucleic acid-binding Zn-ribbon protein